MKRGMIRIVERDARSDEVLLKKKKAAKVKLSIISVFQENIC